MKAQFAWPVPPIIILVLGICAGSSVLSCRGDEPAANEPVTAIRESQDASLPDDGSFDSGLEQTGEVDGGRTDTGPDEQMTDASFVEDAAPPQPPPVSLPAPLPTDVYSYVLLTGQSLATGTCTSPPCTAYTTSVRFPGRVLGISGWTSFCDRVEGSGPCGGTNANEQPLTAGLNQWIGRMADDPSIRLVGGIYALNGAPLERLRRGGVMYGQFLDHLKRCVRLGALDTEGCEVAATWMVHGETDMAEGNLAYAQALESYHQELVEDVRDATNRERPPILLQSQVGSWAGLLASTHDPAGVALQQWEASRSAYGRGRIFLVGPKYHLTYNLDRVHMVSRSYQILSEYFGMVSHRILGEQDNWQPTHLESCTYDENSSEIRCEVHSPCAAMGTCDGSPIVYDNRTLGPSWLSGQPGSDGLPIESFGLEIYDPNDNPSFFTGSCSLTDTQIRCPVARQPGRGATVRTAYHAYPNTTAGETLGVRTTLRDTNSLRGAESGASLFNWLITQEEPVRGVGPERDSGRSLASLVDWQAYYDFGEACQAEVASVIPAVRGSPLQRISGDTVLCDRSVVGDGLLYDRVSAGDRPVALVNVNSVFQAESADLGQLGPHEDLLIAAIVKVKPGSEPMDLVRADFTGGRQGWVFGVNPPPTGLYGAIRTETIFSVFSRSLIPEAEVEPEAAWDVLLYYVGHLGADPNHMHMLCSGRKGCVSLRVAGRWGTVAANAVSFFPPVLAPSGPRVFSLPILALGIAKGEAVRNLMAPGPDRVVKALYDSICPESRRPCR